MFCALVGQDIRLAFTGPLVLWFTNGANCPGVIRPVRKMVLERIVPGGTGFGVNRPVTSFNDPFNNPIIKLMCYVLKELICLTPVAMRRRSVY